MAYTNMTEHSYSVADGGLCKLQGPAAIYSFIAVLFFIAVVASIENMVVIVLIYKYEVLRTPSIVLLGVLAVIDLFTSSVVTPIKIAVTLEEELHTFPYRFLHLFICAFWAAVFLSLSTVLLISIDRFFHVYHLQRYTLTKKKLISGLLVCWTSPIVIISFWALEIYGEEINWFALVYFLFCIIAMIAAYIGMLIELRKHNLSVNNDKNRRNYIDGQKKAVKTTLIIIIMCIILNGPASALIILEEYIGILSHDLCAISFFTLLVSPVVNPLIYCLRIPIMKKQLLKLFRINRTFDENVASDEEAIMSVEDTNV